VRAIGAAAAVERTQLGGGVRADRGVAIAAASPAARGDRMRAGRSRGGILCGASRVGCGGNHGLGGF
jgi:hypothetical protein